MESDGKGGGYWNASCRIEGCRASWSAGTEDPEYFVDLFIVYQYLLCYIGFDPKHFKTVQNVDIDCRMTERSIYHEDQPSGTRIFSSIRS